MKSFAVVLALLVATSNAFSPLFATRAVGKPAVAKKPVATVAVKKAAPKPVAKKAAPKVVAKVAPKPVAKVAPKPVAKKAAPKVVAKVAPKPVAKVAPKPVAKKAVGPSKSFFAGLANLKVKSPPKPKINIQGPKATRVKKTIQYAYDDGLTELERRQRKSLPVFLTGSAKSQADKTAIRPDLVEKTDEYFFSPYDTTLATIGAFAIISLIIKAGSP